MKLKKIEFDDDGDVSVVYISAETTEELVYITDTTGPEGLVFPVTLVYNAEDTATLFHRSGKVPGTHPEYEVSSEIYYALLAVVDRLIEYSI
jgi:hypothetical protein